MIQCVLTFSQVAFAQNGIQNVGLTPYQRASTVAAPEKSGFAKNISKPFTFIKSLPSRFKKNREDAKNAKSIFSNASNSQSVDDKKINAKQSRFLPILEAAKKRFSKKKSTPSNQSEKSVDVKGRAVFDNDLNDPSKAKFNLPPAPEPISNRYTAISLKPSSEFIGQPNRIVNNPFRAKQITQKAIVPPSPQFQVNENKQNDFNPFQTASSSRPVFKSVNKPSKPKQKSTSENQFQWVSADMGANLKDDDSSFPDEIVIPNAPQPLSPFMPNVVPAPNPAVNPSLSTENSDDNGMMKLEMIETPLPPNAKFSFSDGRISIDVRDLSISHVIGYIANQTGLNIVTSSEVVGNVTVSLVDVTLDEALSSILLVNGYTWTKSQGVLLISRLTRESLSSPMTQGKQVQVYPLNYVSALDIDKVVKGLLSPVGQSFITETNPAQKLQTREQIVVEDLPEYLARIGQYIQQVDIAPQQVYIEAHVLQVTLSDENRHGVNFDALLRLGDARLSLESTGFANPAATPAFFLGLESTDLNGLVELLKTTTDSKTLASPKVLVLNGQEARIQIGEQLGYLVTTTTQTSTLQEVNFLDLGVNLRVTPQIAENGQVLMTVKPEVSSGRINPITGLPEEDTTEVETTIMLNNGQGMIIGGLIKETDIDTQVKVPIAGDIWLFGKLFRRQTITRERTEIIIALVPKVMPCGACIPGHNTKLLQATTPLLQPNLRPNNRPWEAKLPDAMYDPRRLRLNRLPELIFNLGDTYPHPPEFYFPAVSEYPRPIFGGSHLNEPMTLSEDQDAFSEFVMEPESF